MSTGDDGARLEALTRQLMARWEQTKKVWRDEKSQEFERHYMEELHAGVESAVTVIRQIDKLITTTRNDCE